ncbi:MAG: hypothetical protein WD733_06815 [Bryobacterales bacterium]
MNETQAAQELGVSKQAFNKYVRGLATPKAHVLARAVVLWKIKVKYRNYEFSDGAFQTTLQLSPEPPFQHELFRDPQVVENDRISVRIESKGGDDLDITIRLKQSA